MQTIEERIRQRVRSQIARVRVGLPRFLGSNLFVGEFIMRMRS